MNVDERKLAVLRAIIEDFIAEIVPMFQPGGKDEDAKADDKTPRAEVGATPLPTPNGA